MTGGRGVHVIASALVVVATGALYANSLGAPFVFDDLQNLLENPRIRITSLDPRSLWGAAFDAPNPRPVANLSFALNHYVGGYAVRGYHLVNAAVHALNGVLVYALCVLLLRRSAGRPGRDALGSGSIAGLSLLGALLFVAHPIQTQAVTYVVQRMASLAAGFYLLGLLAYLLGRSRPPGTARAAWYALCGLSALLGVGAKQNAATLPVAILLAEWFFYRDLDPAWLRRQRWLAAALLLSLVAAGIYLVSADPFSGYAIRDFTMGERLLTQLRVVVFYLSLVLWPLPSRLNLSHAFETSTSLVDPVTTLLSGVALAGLLGVAIAGARRRRLLCFGILWIFLNVAMESSVFPLEMAFEHRMYLPMFGVVLVAVAALSRLAPAGRRVAVALAVPVIAALGLLTVQRNEVWRDELTLWRDVVSKSPRDHRALNNLGRALDRAGRVAEARDRFAAAVEARPDYARGHHNLARALHRLGELERAIEHYREALSLEPRNAVARRDLGLALDRAGRVDEAIGELAESLRLAPESAEGRYALGNLLVRQGRLEEGIPHLVLATRIAPEHAAAHHDLGIAYRRLGREADAQRHLHEALRLRERPVRGREGGAQGDAAGRTGGSAGPPRRPRAPRRLSPPCSRRRRKVGSAAARLRRSDAPSTGEVLGRDTRVHLRNTFRV